MIPFRVFDRSTKHMWQIINYHPDNSGGHYLAAREDDGDNDGDIELIPAQNLKKMKFVDFIDEVEPYSE
ncbi:MAG: hypothetical protein AB7T49_09625 [Oligoflexales bacterium]